MKRQDAIRALVVACVILAALGTLVPGKAPALNPMQGFVTITTTAIVTNSTDTYTWGTYTVPLTFTFPSITTGMTYTSYIDTFTSTVPSYTTYPLTLTATTTSFTTQTTRIITQKLSATTVPSTTTTLTTETATTTGQTIATTANETLTLTFHALTSNVSTSVFTVTGATMPSPPPIPGFPLESILAGLGLGLLGVYLIYRNRRAEGGHS